jgi:hypothetical protein
MPKDSKGNFHNNTQRAMHADKMAGSGPPYKAGKSSVDQMTPKTSEDPLADAESVGHTTLHDHGDGSFHTDSSEGERTEHPTLGHALMHMASQHGADGKHMHAHSDGFSHTTHHVEKGGQPEGPHDHENIEALKQHVGQFLGEEENEQNQQPSPGGAGY